MYAICPPEGGIGIMAKRSMKDSALRIHVTTCVAILLSSNALADPFDTAITIDQLDLEQTATFKQGEVQALDEKALGDTLDPRSAEGKWSAGGPPNWQMRTFSYRLVFKEPTAIRTMFARLNSQYSKGARFL